MSEAKYAIELCRHGGPYHGIDGLIASHDDLNAARKLYRRAVANNPDGVVILCDGGRILARSDEPDSMPQ